MHSTEPSAKLHGYLPPGAARLANALGPLAALGVVILLFAAADYLQGGHSFFTLRNLHATSVQGVIVAVAALGMTLVIISGGIDLSAGTALALSATVLAWCLREGYTVGAALAAAVGCGAAAGLLNGMLISLLRVVPFIVTLGTMTVFFGTAKIVADETTVRPLPEQVPAWLSGMVTTRPDPPWLLYGVVPNFSSGVWFALALAVLLGLVLRYTVFGRYVFALGSNESTARLCGINVPAVKITVYTLSGLFVGLAGIYQFARLSSGNPTSGVGYELRIIAAVVIGGGSLNGGRGSVLGTLAGAAMMAVITSGSNLLGLRNPVQDIIIGVIIVAAVTLDKLRKSASS